jgi:transcriptional regulator with XRE-family HTH domain
VSIGGQLLQTRKEKGISLAAAEEATKIRTRFLEAMENDRFNLLPGRVYAKAFLRIYARFLDLDEAQLAAEFDSLYGTEPTPAAKPQRIKKRRSISSRYRTLFLVLVVVGLLFAFNGIYEVVYGGAGERGPSVEEDRQLPVVNLKPGELVKDAGPQDGHTGLPLADQRQQASEGLNITLNVTSDRCWMRVVADGETAFEGELRAGDTRSFPAQSSVQLRLGNAGVVEVSHNGQNLGYLGGIGQIVTREFSIQNG